MIRANCLNASGWPTFRMKATLGFSLVYWFDGQSVHRFRFGLDLSRVTVRIFPLLLSLIKKKKSNVGIEIKF